MFNYFQDSDPHLSQYEKSLLLTSIETELCMLKDRESFAYSEQINNFYGLFLKWFIAWERKYLLSFVSQHNQLFFKIIGWLWL